ncbi:MAG: aminopeptidase [Planctomycetota bacterium]|nr:MAG: aminopeptidase [Planctomycetota bacterium]
MYRICKFPFICAVALYLLIISATGCMPIGYLLSDATGELLLLASTVPIEDGLNDPALSEEQREKLAFVIRARDYAGEVIGLNIGNSYQGFLNIGDEALAWNLNASKKDVFEPYIFELPVVGSMPYFVFFVFDQAVVERDRLVALGYDTMIYEVDSYSLAIVPDPITSSMLRRDLATLAETVMHELLHNTIYKLGDSVFNESLATFVGRKGAIEFIRSEFGSDSPLADEAEQTFEDDDRFNVFLQELTAEVNEVYSSGLSYDEKLAAREEIFESARNRFAADVLPLINDKEAYERYTEFNYNNAFLLVNVRYNSDPEVYEGIYEMVGGDWFQALTIFSQAAGANDPVGFLRGILAGNN